MPKLNNIIQTSFEIVDTLPKVTFTTLLDFSSPIVVRLTGDDNIVFERSLEKTKSGLSYWFLLSKPASKITFEIFDKNKSCLYLESKTINEIPQKRTPMELYQDQWVNGKKIKDGIVDCTGRYKALQKVLQKYKRPFTILDIGANFGYYSIRAAEDYNAISVMVEGQYNESRKLLELLNKNRKKNNFIVLNNRISLNQLKKLSKCEHFDVVFALNVIHHFPNKISEVCDTFMNLGDNLIVESPPENDVGACGQDNLKDIQKYFSNITSEKLGSFSRHTCDQKADMLWIKNKKEHLNHTYFGYDDLFKKVDKKLHHLLQKAPFQIFSNWDKKTIYNNRHGSVRDWIHGINLKTFLSLNGIYPYPKSIIHKLKTKSVNTKYKWDNSNNDFVVHNLIMNGGILHLIDFDDERSNETTELSDDKCIETIINVIQDKI